MGVYTFFEDRWYGVLERINKVVPICKLTDRIDKVIPSFMLFLVFVLAVLVIAGNYIYFESSLNITFVVEDAKTTFLLEGVEISGAIDGNTFTALTDSEGKIVQEVHAKKQNVYYVLEQGVRTVVFKEKQKKPTVVISVRKEGYVPRINEKVTLDTQDTVRIVLQASAAPPEYPSYMLAQLIDADSGDVIVDPNGSANITFTCANKPDVSKTAWDRDDAATDGVVKLVEDSCQFVVTAISVNGYESRAGLAMTLSESTRVNQIQLSKINIPTTGTARILVSDAATGTGSVAKKMLAGVEVKFLSSGGTLLASGYTDASGVLVKDALDPGVYYLTAASADGNYASLTRDQNKSITITVSTMAELNLTLTKIIPDASRYVKLKLVDANDAAVALAGVTIFAQKINYQGAEAYANGSIGKCVASCQSDSNGFVGVTGLSTANDGNIVVSIYKEGFTPLVVLPSLLKGTDVPQVVALQRVIDGNMGVAKIRVKNSSFQVPLVGARAYLYFDSNVLGVKRVNLLEEGKLTDSNGVALYGGLTNIPPENVYLAKASYQGSDSNMSNAVAIETIANRPVLIDLNINTQLAYFQILVNQYNAAVISDALLAASTVALKGSTGAVVEKVPFVASLGKFKSAYYDIGGAYVLDVNVAGYLATSLSVTTAASGVNTYTVSLYPLSLFADNNVTVLNGGLFASAADYTLGAQAQSFLLNNPNGYLARTDVVLSKDINYYDLLALSRVKNKVVFSNITFISPTATKSKFFSCAPASSSLVNDDNYYFPSMCVVDANGVQVGLDWNGVLARGTYSFTSRMQFTSSAKNGDVVDLNRSAKEKHSVPSQALSENAVGSTVIIGDHFCTPGTPACPNVYFSATLNRVSAGSESYAYSADAKHTFSSAAQITLDTNIERVNIFTISLFNNTQSSLRVADINVYAYAGTLAEFNFQNPVYSAGQSFPKLSFDGPTPQKVYKTLSLQNGFTVPAKSDSNVFSVGVYATEVSANNYLVVLADVNGVTYAVFIDTQTPGKAMQIRVGNFLAGVPNQVVSGEVLDARTQRPVAVDAVTWTTKKDCNTTLVSDLNSGVAQIKGVDKNIFSATIPGVFTSVKNCIEFSAHAIDPAYYPNPVHITTVAGSGGVFDPALACIDVSFVRSGVSMPQVTLAWDTNAVLKIVNHCSTSMNIMVESGVLTSGTCASLAPNAQCSNILVTGKNVLFNATTPLPNTTQVLGAFNVFVYAQDAALEKNYSLAKKLLVHVTDASKCLSLVNDKDSFDATKGELATPLGVFDACQSAVAKDYFFPSLSLSMVGVSGATQLQPYSLVTFDYNILIDGNWIIPEQQGTIRQPVAQTYADQQTVLPTTVSSTWVPSLRSSIYSGLHIDVPDKNGVTSMIGFFWSEPTDMGYLPPLQGGNIYGPSYTTFPMTKKDGNIIVTYRDGTKKIVTVPQAFSPGPEYGAPAYCTNPLNCITVPLKTTMYGLLNIAIPQGNVKSLDFNIITDDDGSLSAGMIVWIDYNDFVEVSGGVVPAHLGPREERSIDAGSASIYPIRGEIVLLKNLLATSTSPLAKASLAVANPTVRVQVKNVYASSNSMGRTALDANTVTSWIEGSYLKSQFIGPVPMNATSVFQMNLTDTGVVGEAMGILTGTDSVNGGFTKN